MNNYIGKNEDKASGKKLLVAYRRLTHALAAELDLTPKQVELAIGRAMPEIRDELDVNEIDPLTYRATPVETLVDAPAETAAKKGRQYFANPGLAPLEIEKLTDYASQLLLVGV